MRIHYTIPVSFWVLLFCLGGMVFSGCKPPVPDNPLDRFQELSLPLEVNMNTFNAEGLYRTQPNADTMYFNPGTRVWGILPDTLGGLHILTLATETEFPVPVYTSFTLKGRKIKSERLGVGRCTLERDCGVDCEEWFRMEEGLVFKSWAITSETPCLNDLPIEGAVVTRDTFLFEGEL